ncbi:hypothetical protein JCM4814A_79320 [Streptomyces phaeofaciens JCM 4814]|uniref:Uncharacterized protein n=1 Tax=Streptomyces phaeofaciens TaxID=68254 RepID=A0A918M0M9_9ACTN|nr:hypothetical protein GCM10010226_83320 [Streptomyces phaeofaciens]
MLLRTDASISASATVGLAAPTGTAGPDEDADLDGEGDPAGEACACCDGGGADPDGGAVVHEVTASSASPYPAPRARSLRPCLLSPICPTPVVEPRAPRTRRIRRSVSLVRGLGTGRARYPSR